MDGPIAQIDLDGTLADYDMRMREALTAISSPSEPELGELWTDEAIPWMAARIRLIRSVSGFWRNLPRLEDGFRVLDLIRDAGYNVSVLTKGPKSTPSAWSEKLEWCRVHLPGTPVTVTSSEKGQVYGRVLFDDYPPYIESWTKHRPRGLVLMLDHPWNRSFSGPNVLRVQRSSSGEDVFQSSLEEVRKALIEAAGR